MQFPNDPIGEQVNMKFLEFLQRYQMEDGTKFYSEQVRIMLGDEDRTTLYIDFQHLTTTDRYLADAIVDNYYRFEIFLRKATQTFIKELEQQKDTPGDEEEQEKEYWVSFYNLPAVHRLRVLRTNKLGKLLTICGTVTRTSEVRPELLYGTFLCLDCRTVISNVAQQFAYTEPKKCLGHSVNLLKSSFLNNNAKNNPKNGADSNSDSNPDGPTWSSMSTSSSSGCNNTSRWELLVEESKFVDWQKVRLQENAAEIPAGCTPRSIDVVLRHETVEKIKAGDRVNVTGCLIVVPELAQARIGAGSKGGKGQYSRESRGAQKNGGEDGVRFGSSGNSSTSTPFGSRDLNYRMCFLASFARPLEIPLSSVLSKKISDGDDEEENLSIFLSEEERNEFLAEARSNDENNDENDENQDEGDDDEAKKKKSTGSTSMPSSRNSKLYDRLTQSVAPFIWGHDDVKRGLLLLLFGGVTKHTPTDGIRLRGDLNVCLVGDPSTSKSQFLKWISSSGVVPRAVYTSGKASSAAGLTASVVKDPDTGDFNIEAGALMLADNGVCCIDEFDKMELKDQVAIHEAMEQQTISISKAGLQANLVARCSVLAAANPIGGRYDLSKSLRGNIAMTPAIMSRFDLFFIVLDACDAKIDEQIARHIVSVHSLRGELAKEVPFPPRRLLNFLKFARTIKPVLSEEASQALVRHYTQLRQFYHTTNSSTSAYKSHARSGYRITVRQLESLIRLSEALARLHLKTVVEASFVDEAARLLRKSLVHVHTSEVTLQEKGDDVPLALAPKNTSMVAKKKAAPMKKPAETATSTGTVKKTKEAPKKKTTKKKTTKAKKGRKAKKGKEAEEDEEEEEEEEEEEDKDEEPDENEEDDIHVKISSSTSSGSSSGTGDENVNSAKEKEGEDLMELDSLSSSQSSQSMSDESQSLQLSQDTISSETESLKISFADYSHMTQQLLRRIKACEETGASGVTFKELTSWYLEKEVQIAFKSSKEKSKHRELVEKVIKRMITKDHSVLEVNKKKKEGILVVHPNSNMT